jgi:protein-disulfide isomerase-like protein with CxxC motif
MPAFKLRPANERDAPIIWDILQGAIEQRRLEGSDQWQNGYPSEQTVQDDLAAKAGYVLTENDTVVAYAAIVLDGEPAYDAIDGKWLTDGRYATVHRVARARDVKGKGVATAFLKSIEGLCMELDVPSIRLDTNFDNLAMLKILETLSYRYCGEIFYEGAPRWAYEKILSRPTDA